MVMLDILAQKFPKSELIIAHFDHGIRKNSGEDAYFAERQASNYGVEIAMGKGALGENASEEKAREARYDFLKKVAAKMSGEVYTAHHLDDLVGSVAINLVRGTGWRGLAVLNTAGVHRPFLEDYAELGFEKPPTKKDLLRYASEHNLRFREDQTNSYDEYLRNRLYRQMDNFDRKMAIFGLWQRQNKLRDSIDILISELLPKERWQRNWFRGMPEKVALEILRAGLLKKGIKTTRPQLKNFLAAIHGYAPGKYFNLPGDRMVRLDKNDFSIN